jgi:hypothetical protein
MSLASVIKAKKREGKLKERDLDSNGQFLSELYYKESNTRARTHARTHTHTHTYVRPARYNRISERLSAWSPGRGSASSADGPEQEEPRAPGQVSSSGSPLAVPASRGPGGCRGWTGGGGRRGWRELPRAVIPSLRALENCCWLTRLPPSSDNDSPAATPNRATLS